jgi:CubicO group peptidase (beta-lactamase class C family)
VWHNGGTGGYSSFVGFDPEQKLGVVVLSNQASPIDALGLHLLDPRYPLPADGANRRIAVMTFALFGLVAMAVLLARKKRGSPSEPPGVSPEQR